MPLPKVVVHADWSKQMQKRWEARAILQRQGRYLLDAPQPVGVTSTYLRRLRGLTDEAVLLGLDFPIGLPIAYARRAGIDDFLAFLPRLGRGEWSEFYEVAEKPDEISLRRPFYPYRPGGTKRTHLLSALNVDSLDALRRRCDLKHPGRPAAEAIFWTLGAKQVGKAAIHGWRELLSPGLDDIDLKLAIWPFAGELARLFARNCLVAAESYPAEYYTPLGLSFAGGSKRVQSHRQANAAALRRWADAAGVELTSALRAAIDDGFGGAPTGDDQFDAFVGLCGILDIVLGRRSSGLPDDVNVRRIEGWILGCNPSQPDNPSQS